MEETLIGNEFYKEIYLREFERKSNIDSLLSFPVTFLTLLLAGGLYLIELAEFHNIKETHIIITIGIIIFLTLFISSVIISIWFLSIFYLNSFKKYKYLPFALDLKYREQELIKFYEDYYIKEDVKKPKKKALNYAREQFDTDLRNYYTEYASHNQLVNDKRIINLYNARKFLIFALAFLFLMGIFLLIKK